MAAALTLVVCGATVAGAEGNRIPGTYEPAKKSFRLYPVPRAPAAGVSSAMIYRGTLKITARLGLSVPAGTKVSVYVDASVGDSAGGFDNSASGEVTSSGPSATIEFSIPYAVLLADPSDQLMIYLNASASYTNKDDVSYSPNGSGVTTLTMPKNGAVTPVTLAVGL